MAGRFRMPFLVRKVWLLGLAALASVGENGLAHAMVSSIRWQEMPELPPGLNQARQPGVAGPFAGASNGVLLVAGGANFPELPPWDGGTKAWKDDIFMFEPAAGGGGHWSLSPSLRLPHAMGYGMSFSTPEGIVCAGGCDGQRCYREVFVLRWNPARREIELATFPPLPAPLAMMGGAQVGQTLYLVGGQQEIAGAKPTRTFWSLDLSKRDQPDEFKWTVLEPWPGPPRVVPVAAAQGSKLYLFSGRVQAEGQHTTLLTDAFVHDPAGGGWTQLRDIQGERTDGTDGFCLMAGVAMPVGNSELLFTSGDHGSLYMQLEALDFRAADARKRLAAASPAERASCQRELDAALEDKRELSVHHPGFGRDILVYETATDRWRKIGESPAASQVTTVAVSWNSGWVIPNGEVRPAVRTPRVVWVQPINSSP